MKKILLPALLLLLALLPQGVRGAEPVESSLLGVSVPQEQGVTISFVGGALRVQGAAGLMLEVYNVTGVKVLAKRLESADQTVALSLPRGCYIVKVGKTVRRINVL